MNRPYVHPPRLTQAVTVKIIVVEIFALVCVCLFVLSLL